MVLSTLINHPELLSRETLYELRGIVARYPYFQTARMLMLNNMYLLHDPDFGVELRRSVFYITDRRALCRLIEGYADKVISEGSVVEEPSVDRTMSLIDAFLETLPEDNAVTTLLGADAMGDYVSQYLVEEGREDQTAPQNDSVARALELIEQKPETIALDMDEENLGLIQSHEEETLDESYFTETLAKIYIKQRKYSRALEIIRSLYLQFPEKNAYFADQIRFLEKLIINNNLK